MAAYAERLSPAEPTLFIPMNALSGDVKTDNLKKLDVIQRLKKNWNGNGAAPFSPKEIDRMKVLINELRIQPEIFPTALQTIQFEYDNARRDHMEIEIGTSNTAEVFIVTYFGEESFEALPVTAAAINQRVEAFYG